MGSEALFESFSRILQEQGVKLDDVLETIMQSEFSDFHPTTDMDDSLLTRWFTKALNLEEVLQEPSLKILPSRVIIEQTSNRYQKQSLIGKGGFGHVWKAEDTLLHRTLVAKRAEALNERSALLFIREAQTCAQLQHPGICPMYDIIMTGDNEFELLMKEIRGQELLDVIKSLPHQSNSKVTVEEINAALFTVIEKMRKVCNTIAYAHSRGVAHLDIKPRNIMIGRLLPCR